MVAEFEARQGYLTFGLASTAQWLSHTCGIAHRTAVEHVRVARALRQHPRLAEEMGAGRLSYSQIRVISRIDGPNEQGLIEDLIEAAKYANVAQLEVVVRGLRTVDHNDKATDPGEYLKQSWTADSRWQLTARLDPEGGPVVGAAIDAIVNATAAAPAERVQAAGGDRVGVAGRHDERDPAVTRRRTRRGRHPPRRRPRPSAFCEC